MKTAQNTRNLLLRALTERFSYEHPGQGLKMSKAVSSDARTLEGILRKEEFVCQVILTNGPAWEMPKTMTRHLPQRLTPLGKSFYELLRWLSLIPNKAWHEPGLFQQLFDRVAEEMELQPQSLKTDPLYQHSERAPLEGESVNSFVEMIRKLGREPKFEARKKEREKQAKRQQREAKKLISALSDKSQTLFGQWITLEYQFSENFPPEPNLLESNAHLHKFRDGLQDLSRQLQSIGQIWMRHYLPETGFRIRMLLLYTPKVIAPRTDWADQLKNLWSQTTDGRGQFAMDSNSEGPHAIEQALKIHALSETVIRSIPESEENFGCFDSFDMCFLGLPAPQPAVAENRLGT